MRKLKWYFEPHWIIIGNNTKEVIGCCSGRDGLAVAMYQEPNSTFKRVRRSKCPICKEE